MNNAGRTDPKNRLNILLLIVVLIRVVVALILWKINGVSGFFSPDTGVYVESAQNMLHGSFSHSGLPEIFRTPGYPLLLMPAVVLHHPVIIALFENFLFATASAGLIWKIVIDLVADQKAAFWAVVLYCFEPMSLLYSEKILTETTFTTLLLLFVWLLLRFLREPTYTRLALSALILGCATYVRPVTLYLPFALVPILLLFPRALPWRKRILRTVAFPVIFAVTLAPWIMRNATVADYRSFSSTGDIDLYFYCAAAVEAKSQHKTLVQVQKEIGYSDEQRYFELHPEQRGWSPGQVARFCRVEGKKTILQNLPSYSVIHGRGCVTVLLDPGVTEILKLMRLYPESGGLLSRALDQGFIRATLWLFRQYPVSAIMLPLLEVLLLFSYALALLGLRRLPFDAALLFAAIAIYFVLISGLPGAVARYRVPIVPLICICAGLTISYWKTKRDGAATKTNPRPLKRRGTEEAEDRKRKPEIGT